MISVAEAKKFYSAVFGWRFEDYGPDYASFSDGRLSGGFTGVSSVRQGGALVIMYSVNIEETKRKVVDAGGKIVKDTFEFPGGQRFHFSDPSGNELAVWSDRPSR